MLTASERHAARWISAARYGALGVAAALAAAVAGYPAMVSSLYPNGDEGYFLISIKEYLAGGALYDDVFSQYGPGYHEILGGALRLLGLDVDHDTARMIGLTAWATASFLCGATLVRLTGSLPIGLAGVIVAFYALSGLIYDVIHPGELLVILLAGIVALGAFVLPVRPSPAMFAIGGFAAALALIKLNVGLLALLAIAFACVNSVPALRRLPALRPGIALLLAVTPFVLMASNLSNWSLWSYALVVALGAVAVVIAASKLPAGLELRHVYALGAGVVAVTVAVLAVIFIQGTTVHGLVDGILIRPLAFPGQVFNEFPFPSLAPLAGALAVGAAAVATRRGELSEAISGALGAWVVPAGRIAAGFAIWIATLRVGGADPVSSAFGHDFHPGSFAIAAPLAWVAAIPPRSERRSPSAAFVRSVVPALAVMQLLHAYPTPTTQVAWAMFLFAIVGGICVADGLRDLEPALGRPIRPVVGNIAVIAFIAVVLVGPFRDWANGARRSYDAGTPLGLPGADRLRLPAQQVADLRNLTAELRRSCSTFIGLPGLNSSYLFTGEDPPTGMNASAWPILFDDDDQERIVEQIRGIPRLCAVRNAGALAFFRGRPEVFHRPLVRYIQRRFTVRKTISQYQVMERTGASP